MTIKFGTDGWRAVISDEFTFANVRHVAQAIGEVFLEMSGESLAGAARNGQHGHPLVVVGFDTRFLSDRYAIAVSEVLAANGLRVALAKADAPTPVISYAIPNLGAVGGVMITASHNPPRYNGIKLKAAFGGGASNAETRAGSKSRSRRTWPRAVSRCAWSLPTRSRRGWSSGSIRSRPIASMS